MAAAAARGFSSATLAVFFGKAVKMAQNIPHTHAAKSELTLEALARWTLEQTGRSGIWPTGLPRPTLPGTPSIRSRKAPRQVIAHVAEQAQRCAVGFSENKLRIRCLIFDYDGTAAG
jgi:cobalt-precorrin-5B (C1)-methyltransferase